MKVTIENGKIIFSDNDNSYSFEAHGEYPRPSFMPAISVGGKHLSDRSDDIKIEKHTAVQDAALGNGMAAWYTQEFLPDGVDYKLSKKAAIYLGNFASGEEKLIYKGECYGDLCFDENDLYFNIGNKVAVYHIPTGETEILFKHSGIKKSYLDLHITPKRIFFLHWTHSNNQIMWYDRETKEVINPHINGNRTSYIDDETIIYQGLDHAWLYNVTTMKKKRFFSNKEESRIIDMVAEFFDIPKEYFGNYHSSWSDIKFDKYKDNRVCFKCFLNFKDSELCFEEQEKKSHALGLPSIMKTLISSDRSAKDIRIEADKSDIEREEKPYSELIKEKFDFPMVIMSAFPKSNNQ